jgi:hypothetical protein
VRRGGSGAVAPRRAPSRLWVYVRQVTRFVELVAYVTIALGVFLFVLAVAELVEVFR